MRGNMVKLMDFPSFSEGLSLRLTTLWLSAQQRHFPFLFGRGFH